MSPLLSYGIELMLVGMGIVFIFLALLIVMVNVMTASLQKFFPDTILPETTTPVTSSTTQTDKAIIAAISAAVHQYRNRN